MNVSICHKNYPTSDLEEKNKWSAVHVILRSLKIGCIYLMQWSWIPPYNEARRSNAWKEIPQ
jgi:hypothetical protein